MCRGGGRGRGGEARGDDAELARPDLTRRRDSDMRRARQPLIDEGNENIWPSFADLTSTVTLLFFVLMLLAYMQNLIAGRNLEAATRRLAESRRQITDAEGRLKLLGDQLRATTAEIEAGQNRLRLSEDRVETRTRELAAVRARLQGIAVLREDE